MGCVNSRIDETELVLRCKNRKRLMKLAVGYRQEFAIAHMAYIHSLKNFGSSLRQFSEGDYSHDEEGNDANRPSTPLLTLPSQTSSSLLLPPPISPPSSPPHLVPAVMNSPPHPLFKSPSQPNSYAASKSVNIPPSQQENGFLSSKSSPVGTPMYSPDRDEPEEFYMSFDRLPSLASPNPPPPPSPPRDSPWDFFGFFHPPPVPFHLEEQRRVKALDREEERQHLQDVREQEGIPDLEEEEPKIDEKERESDGRKDEEKKSTEALEVVTDKEETDLKAVKVEEPSAKDALAAAEEAVELEKKEYREDTKDLVVCTTLKVKNLKEVARDVDDQFIRAYASGRDVARMLEATKAQHYKESKDSARVFNAITWHWSNKTPLALQEADREDTAILECGMTGSHSSTLERLYAWERKLHDEVKAGEIVRMAFDRKCEQLKVQSAKGEDPNAIDKTRAIVKTLDTQLIVALRAIHSVSLRIQMLTNEELYPQLVEILEGLRNMWNVMLECHKTQADIALELKSLENSDAGEDVTEAHRKATIKLENELNNWQIHFSRWITCQKYYIDALVAWLRLCHMDPETDNKGRIVSPFWGEGPPVYSLLKKWQKALKNLAEQQEVMDSVFTFSTVLHSLQLEQLEELQQKRNTEILSKDLNRRSLSLQAIEQKYVDSQTDATEKQATSSTLHERRCALNNIRSRVEEEKQRLVDTCHSRQEATLATLKENLGSIFKCMSSFAEAALEEYENIQHIPESRRIQHF